MLSTTLGSIAEICASVSAKYWYVGQRKKAAAEKPAAAPAKFSLDSVQHSPFLRAPTGGEKNFFGGSTRQPVEDYLRTQKRFAHLFRKDHEDTARIRQLQRMADFNIERFGLIEEGVEL